VGEAITIEGTRASVPVTGVVVVVVDEVVVAASSDEDSLLPQAARVHVTPRRPIMILPDIVFFMDRLLQNLRNKSPFGFHSFDPFLRFGMKFNAPQLFNKINFYNAYG
jgi:hypothetical protein